MVHWPSSVQLVVCGHRHRQPSCRWYCESMLSSICVLLLHNRVRHARPAAELVLFKRQAHQTAVNVRSVARTLRKSHKLGCLRQSRSK